MYFRVMTAPVNNNKPRDSSSTLRSGKKIISFYKADLEKKVIRVIYLLYFVEQTSQDEFHFYGFNKMEGSDKRSLL